MLNCKESTRLISQAQDRSLSLTEQTALVAHVLICAGCRRYRDQMNFLRTVLRRHPAYPDTKTDSDRTP
ncbi:MAG: hypothetical protein RIR70_1438 [Pseudomonadota bacterium]|jgi:hypothetical protein